MHPALCRNVLMLANVVCGAHIDCTLYVHTIHTHAHAHTHMCVYIYNYIYIYCKCGSNSTKTQGKVPCHTTTLLRPHSFLYAPLKALSPQRLLYGRPRPPKTVAQTYGSTGKTRIPPSAAPMGCPEPVFSAEVRRLAKLSWRPLDRPMDRHVGEMRSFTLYIHIYTHTYICKYVTSMKLYYIT